MPFALASTHWLPPRLTDTPSTLKLDASAVAALGKTPVTVAPSRPLLILSCAGIQSTLLCGVMAIGG